MSGNDTGIAPDARIPEPAITQNRAAETAALLASSRQLIADAVRILSEAPTGISEERVGAVLYKSLDVGTSSRPARSKEPAHFYGRRLVAAVPAAAGIALLSAGLAALTGGHGQHALTVDLQGSNSHPSTSVAPPVPQPAAPKLEVPATLSVARLHSNAVVAGEVQVQTTGPESGLLDAPADYHQLGWYRHGDTGALVLDGHVGYRTDPGPLAFIGSLGAGDVVVVGFPSGDRAFSVTVVDHVLKGQLPQQYFSTQYNGDLMLITCDYTSPFRAGHFQDNVYAVAVPSQ